MLSLTGGRLAALRVVCAPKALDSAVGLLPAWSAVALWASAGAAVVVIAVVALWRCRRSARALVLRQAFDLLPTNSFDPSPEDIVRFASGLRRCRPRVSLLTSRRAQSVRIHLATDDAGRLGFRVEGPSRAAGVLGANTYPQVEVCRVERAADGAVVDDGSVVEEAQVPEVRRVDLEKTAP